MMLLEKEGRIRRPKVKRDTTFITFQASQCSEVVKAILEEMFS